MRDTSGADARYKRTRRKIKLIANQNPLEVHQGLELSNVGFHLPPPQSGASVLQQIKNIRPDLGGVGVPTVLPVAIDLPVRACENVAVQAAEVADGLMSF